MEPSDAFKILLSAVSSYLFYKAYTPPHAPMDPTKRDKKVKGAFTSNTSQYFSIMKSHMQLLLGLAEISSILAKSYPSSQLSIIAQSLFLFTSGDPSKLHLSPAHIVGGLLMILGGYIRITAMATLGKLFSFQVGIQNEHRLIKHGLYSIVRHPSYMGMQLTHVGYLLWHLTPGSWVRESGILELVVGRVVVGAYVVFVVGSAYVITVARMRQEDEMMKTRFGSEWQDWAKKVPSRVLPGIY